MEHAVWTHHMLHNSLNSGWPVIAAASAVGEACKISGPKCGRGAARIKASAGGIEGCGFCQPWRRGRGRKLMECEWTTAAAIKSRLEYGRASPRRTSSALRSRSRPALLTCRSDNGQISCSTLGDFVCKLCF